MEKTTKRSTRSASRTAQTETLSGNPELDKFFYTELRDIYWAEKQLTKALPKMMQATTSEQLQEALDMHLQQTQEHVERLEEIFEAIGKKEQRKKCEAMEGLIKEGESVVEDTAEGSMTRDVAIIIACQKIEHYEIAAYGGLAQLARNMGREDITELLEATLEEEKQADLSLTEIAENDINWEAQTENNDLEAEEE
ncbi:MAG: ferritin-like domain-containing protein [Sphingobacteriales bacterium]|nr:ferritin-like domain-containing protein [Sphingobacteriales bacterium]